MAIGQLSDPSDLKQTNYTSPNSKEQKTQFYRQIDKPNIPWINLHARTAGILVLDGSTWVFFYFLRLICN